jgi:ElaB/YqjD/DUF883 family membrane-anchored ribosome-binding protein
MANQYPQSGTQSARRPDQSRSQIKDEDKGLVDKASDTVRSAADQAAELAERAMEQGREVKTMAQKAPGAMREAIDTSLKQRPMVTLTVAGALGFLLGALWKS